MTRIVTFIFFDLPSMILIYAHKFVVVNIRKEFWRPWNIWIYRMGGLFLIMGILAVAGAVYALREGTGTTYDYPAQSRAASGSGVYTETVAPSTDSFEPVPTEPIPTEPLTPAVGTLVSPPDMVVGECFTFTNRKAALHNLRLVDCESPHSGEVMAIADSALYAYPVTQAEQDAAARNCSQGAMRHDHQEGSLGQWIAVTGSERDWYRGDNTVACIWGRYPPGLGPVPPTTGHL